MFSPRTLLLAINALALATAAFTVYATLARKGVVLFSWHPIFMGIGLLAITVGSAQHYLPLGAKREGWGTVSFHGLASLAGVACVLIGLAAILTNKIVNNKRIMPHSWHAWMGVLAVILILAQAYGAVQARDWLRKYALPQLTAFHRLTGLPVFILLSITSILGFFSMFNKPNPAENDLQSAMIGSAGVALSTAAVLLLATGWYKRITASAVYDAVPQQVGADVDADAGNGGTEGAPAEAVKSAGSSRTRSPQSNGSPANAAASRQRAAKQ